MTQPYYAYLIRLSKPLGSERHQARYYLGISNDWIERFQQHCTGQGAKMLAYARRHAIGLRIIRVWRFPDYATARQFEVWAKRSVKSHRKLLDLPAWITLAA